MPVCSANGTLEQAVAFEIYCDSAVTEANRIGVFDLSTLRVLIRFVSLHLYVTYDHNFLFT